MPMLYQNQTEQFVHYDHFKCLKVNTGVSHVNKSRSIESWIFECSHALHAEARLDMRDVRNVIVTLFSESEFGSLKLPRQRACVVHDVEPKFPLTRSICIRICGIPVCIVRPFIYFNDWLDKIEGFIITQLFFVP